MNNNFEKIFNNRWIELLLRCSLGILFIYSSSYKIINPAAFAKIIYGYYLFPHYLINLAAIVLPFIELVAGICLISGIYPKSAAAIISGMLFIFSITLIINRIRGVEFDCGCLSFNPPGYFTHTGWALTRNFFLLLSGLYILFYNKKRLLSLSKTGYLSNNSPTM